MKRALAAILLAGTSCLQTSPLARTFVPKTEMPASMAALPDGGLVYGELRTGTVLKTSGPGRPGGLPDADLVLATIDVSTSGQRGLLGLAEREGELYASWTDPDRRLVVAQIAPGPRRDVWHGPVTADLGNGGRIAFDPEGHLVIGVGDMQAPKKVGDPAEPNGKMLRLDPDGPPTQTPEMISSGWNNPFAFAITPAGEMWVADNAPGAGPERLARGDLSSEPSVITELPADTIPTGLAVLGDGSIVLCGLRGDLVRYAIDGDGVARRDDVLRDDCALGVVLLADGRLAYATEDSIRVLRP